MKLQSKLSDEDLELNVELVKKIFTTFPADRLTKVHKMFEKIGQEYFLAPASSRQEYHSCYPGGLCAHSLNVVKQLHKLANALVPGKWSGGTLNFVGLFHDFGKIGDGDHAAYVPNEDEYWRNKGKLYVINEECLDMPSSERGLFVLQKFGVDVTPEEYLAIRLNDGPYPPENEPYKMKEPQLALLVHWADRWSCSIEKD